ncbi:MAG: 3-deoxy-7-phosphoheptulonate synthase, partial [Candidatus Humimicrobiaceae bacterium]
MMDDKINKTLKNENCDISQDNILKTSKQSFAQEVNPKEKTTPDRPVKYVKDKNIRLIEEGYITVIAGPCAIESKEQLDIIAGIVKESGLSFLRAGAYKPRTSPYSFQGLEHLGLEILQEIA